MKRLIVYIIILIAFLGIGFSSCENDPEPYPADAREAFAGIWLVTETETKLTYEVTVELDPKALNGRVFISNFANAGSSSNPANAYVSGITITLGINEVIGDGWIVNGSGILSGSTINWPYTLDNGADLLHISAIYTRH